MDAVFLIVFMVQAPRGVLGLETAHRIIPSNVSDEFEASEKQEEPRRWSGADFPRGASFGMLVHLALAFVLIVVSVVIHALGTLAVIVRLANALQSRKGAGSRVTSGILTIRVVSSLLLLHLLEASAWAALYWLARALPDVETAFYFSLTSYTTVGYGDVVLPPDWRLLGPIEAATGILMFGWSTGVMVTAINRIYAEQLRRLADPNEPE